MKIGYFLRPSARFKSGGDLIQAGAYLREMSSRGHDVTIGYTDEYLVGSYDIVHLFNLDRPWDGLRVAQHYKGKAKVILSPIHHPEERLDLYQRKYGDQASRILRGFGISQTSLEHIKAIVRSVSIERSWALFKSTIADSYRVAQVKLCEACDGIIFLAQEEGFRVGKLVDLRQKVVAYINNGVDQFNDSVVAGGAAFLVDGQFSGKWAAVVGRIEPRKNQIGIIKAVDGLDVRVIFVGALNKSHSNYTRRFENCIRDSSQCVYAGEMSQGDVHNVMKSVHLHISASFLEVAPLVDLEAASVGLPFVYSKAGYGDYTGMLAFGCEPNTVDSIRQAVLEGLGAVASGAVQSGRVASWKDIGDKLEVFYREILL